MRNKWFCYIKIDETNNFVLTSGMEFRNFMNGIRTKPSNILILKGSPADCSFSNNLFMEYITNEHMESFLKDDVYSYGDFCWVDFEDEDSLKKVTEQELAELLYVGHKKMPLSKIVFDSLKNKIIYLCHDDDYWVKVYMLDIKDYKKVIEHKILTELKGRKKQIAPISDEIMNIMYDYFKNGAVIDFENSYDNGVRIYPIGEMKCVENIHAKLDRQRNMPRCGLCLDYNPRAKKWKIF